MKRVMLGVAAVAMSLAFVATAEAGPKGGSHGGSMGKSGSHSYHMEHGTKFKGGYFYKGKDHYHWTYRYWYGKYGCYTYYCPSTCGWYYWYPQDSCYYPVTYIVTATPVREVAPVGVPTGVTQITNVTNNSPGAAAAPVGPAAPMPPSP